MQPSRFFYMATGALVAATHMVPSGGDLAGILALLFAAGLTAVILDRNEA